MKLRKNADTLKQVTDLIEYAFLKNDDLTQNNTFMSRYLHSADYGIMNGNKLASYLMVTPFQSHIFSKSVQMAGIGYVASYPEYRGQGGISKLFKEVFHDLHEQNIPLSNLAPFSENFYRQYGYENTIYQKVYSFDKNALKGFKMPKKRKLLRGKWNDLEIQNYVVQLYEAQLHTKAERNTVVRPQWWWNRINEYYPYRNIVISLDENERPRGYMVYRIYNSTFHVEEMYYLDRNSAKDFLAFMASHISSRLKFEVIMPTNALLEDVFPEQQFLNITLVTYMMSRIIDFKKIMSCMQLNRLGTFNIEVTDDQLCPWNNGVWEIEDYEGTLLCNKVEGDPDYSASINNWSKILLGELTLSRAIEAGDVHCNRNQRIEFKKGKTSFYDYF